MHRYRCQWCGRTDVDARARGCGMPTPTYVTEACPMVPTFLEKIRLFLRHGFWA